MCWLGDFVLGWSIIKKKKNLERNKSYNKGLISEDRSNKATLQLTIPRSLFNSSAKGLSPETFQFAIGSATGALVPQ